MMVFGHSGTGGGFLPAKQQVFPLDYEVDFSQRLLEASYTSDLKSAFDCIDDPYVDVNFVGAVSLKVRVAEVHCRDESENVVRFDYQDLKTDVTALFVAVHTGNVALVRKLLSRGADVNQKLFRGFSMTAAVREGHIEIFEILLKAGASQPSCEEALLEASCHGRGGTFIELLMASDLIRPHIAVHALVTACCRGFIDVVDVLLKSGADINASARVLLCSSKPSLHTNINCTPLVAAVVSRQVAVVRLLLQAGANINVKVQLGAWSWDMASGDEFRVGAGLAEPYAITWCAVEYFEETGSILQMLLQQIAIDTCHNARTLLHHAVLCGNAGAVKTLIKCGIDIEYPVKTTQKNETRAIHMAARLGFPLILRLLIDSGCDINSRTKPNGETAAMICAKFKHEDCLRVLTKAGADLGLTNFAGQSARSIADCNKWCFTFQQAVLDVIRSGTVPTSSNPAVFSPLMFVAYSGDVQALKPLILQDVNLNLDEQDDNGFSAVMVTAMEGHIEAFRLLVYAGADVKLINKSGETAISLAKMNKNSDMFEKVMIEFTLEKGNKNARGFYPLHYAARHGDVHAVRLLTSRGYDVNIPDGDGYTPLMLAAREGHGPICELLISCGSVCGFANSIGETALSLARKHKRNEAEGVILDVICREVVIRGGNVLKHTKGGRGVAHMKSLNMVKEGVLRWGNSKSRNVVCRNAEVGPSVSFEKCRRKKGDANVGGVFHVVTMKNREVHFVCEGGLEMAELWVRGIKLVTREAVK